MKPWDVIGWIILSGVGLTLLIVILSFVVLVVLRRKMTRETLEWRKRMKVGDRCWFDSMGGMVPGMIYGPAGDDNLTVPADKETVQFLSDRRGAGGGTTNWRKKTELYLYNNEGKMA